MDKEVPRRAMKGIISVLIKNNEEKTKENDYDYNTYF